MGDRVEARLESTRGQFGQGPETAEVSEWKLTLEVVKREPGFVWVHGDAHSTRNRALTFLFAVSTEALPPREAPNRRPAADGGTVEQLAVGPRLEPCTPWEVDGRRYDGPVTRGCDTSAPPFYLLGSLKRTEGRSGMGGYFRSSLTVTGSARGPEAAPDRPLPKETILYAPHSWFRRIPTDAANPNGYVEQVEEAVVDGQVVPRSRTLTRVLRTRKDLGRTDLTALDGKLYSVEDRWSRLRTTHLIDVLFAVLRHPDPPGTSGSRETLRVSTGDLAVERPGGGRQAYAADPFDPVLAGLSWGGRAGPVQDADVRLWDWGTGPLPPAPPAAEGATPDTLSPEEFAAPVVQVWNSLPCHKRKQGRVDLLDLKVELLGSGKPAKATVALSGKQPSVTPLPAATARCFERQLMKLVWPPFGQPSVPFELGLPF